PLPRRRPPAAFSRLHPLAGRGPLGPKPGRFFAGGAGPAAMPCGNQIVQPGGGGPGPVSRCAHHPGHAAPAGAGGGGTERPAGRGGLVRATGRRRRAGGPPERGPGLRPRPSPCPVRRRRSLRVPLPGGARWHHRARAHSGAGMTGRSAQTPVSGPPAAAKEWPRLWEIDALRGLAVVAMVIYHAMWDLMFTGLYAGDVTSGGWRLFARTTATTFFLLVGVSMTLLTARHPQGVPYRRWAQRGLKLLAWGMVISLITWPLFGRQFIAYGVLHFIGTALLLAPLLLRWRTWAVPLAVVLIGIGLVLVE